VDSEWQGADLRALTRVQLRPYAPANAKRLQIEGPAILLPSELATPFALVLHELATNAAKYGALSEQAGHISVRWDVSKNNGRRDLRLVWHERGGPSPAKAPPAGLGSDLIDHAIPRARVRRELHEDGLVCTIELSLLE
jgi:two-component system CheB/CheR fusion protein